MIFGAPESVEVWGRVHLPKHRAPHRVLVGGVPLSDRLRPYIGQNVRASVWRRSFAAEVVVVGRVTAHPCLEHDVMWLLRHDSKPHVLLEPLPTEGVRTFSGELVMGVDHAWMRCAPHHPTDRSERYVDMTCRKMLDEGWEGRNVVVELYVDGALFPVAEGALAEQAGHGGPRLGATRLGWRLYQAAEDAARERGSEALLRAVAVFRLRP